MAKQKKERRSFGEWMKAWYQDLIAIAVLLIIMFGICKVTPAIMNSAVEDDTEATAAIVTMVDVEASPLI